MFALIDCNNFYVSCERLFRPDLVDRPVIVLSNNDGCVISRSNEAKALGIQMGVPFFKIQMLAKRHRVEVFSSNYTLYGDLSHRVMYTIESFWSEVEWYSIDEVFLDLGKMKAEQATSICEALQKKVQRDTGIPTSIGIGTTKTLAKAANCLAKKILNVPVFCLSEPTAWLSRIPVEDVWGVGRQWSDKLQRQGIKTAADLAKQNADALRRRSNVMLMRTVMELQGIVCQGLLVKVPAKSIMASRSFGQMQAKKNALAQALSRHAARASEKLREEGLLAKRVTIFLRSNRHRLDLPQYNPYAGVSLIHPSQDTRVITQMVLKSLDAIFKEGVLYKKVGVLLEDLIPPSQRQTDLFSSLDPLTLEKSERVMKVMDRINGKYGWQTVRLASQGYDQGWALRAENCSPSYTTRWSDIPIVK
ncbi:MAG: Y-family DNA polymerase [Legionella sp.]|nr:Y-family DNA polymerase [Legionella sp.]